MGKRQKVTAFFLAALLLSAVLWRLTLPAREKARLAGWLEKNFGYALQMESLRLSWNGLRVEIEKGLLLDPDLIEHPILSADRIAYTRPLSKIVLTAPKLSLTRAKTAPAGRLARLLAELRRRGLRLDFSGGEGEIWEKRPFEGTPLRVTGASASLRLGETSSGPFSFELPSGLRGLAPLFRAARELPDKKLTVSGEAAFASANRAAVSGLLVSQENETALEAARMSWEIEGAAFSLSLEKPVFSVERTQANRWRAALLPAKNLFALEAEAREALGFGQSRVSLSGGAVFFADKSVFPLFAAVLEDASLGLKTNGEIWGWQASFRMKDFPESRAELAGAYSWREATGEARGEARNFPLAPFFPYYHRQIPYEKLGGTFSGSFDAGMLHLVLRGPFGAPVPERPDRIAELTGRPAAEWLETLAAATGEARLEIPFTRGWEEPLAKTLLERKP